MKGFMVNAWIWPENGGRITAPLVCLLVVILDRLVFTAAMV